jgi:hypothetical protein
MAQGLSGIRPRLPPDREQILCAVLDAPLQSAFKQLPAYDQRHLCAVYRSLRDSGSSSPDLLLAALLHDIGKTALSGRVTLLDRTLNVLLAATIPPVHARLTRLPASRWRLGLALAHHHPRLGAELAAQLGCSDRTCWLIAHHADDPPPPDPDLLRLIEADATSR